VLKPVKGRVFFGLPFGSAELVVVVAAVVAVGVGVGVGVVVTGVVCGVLVAPDEPELEPEPPELLWWWFEQSGSMYCWSPADPPPPHDEASDTAGLSTASKPRMIMQAKMCLARNTRRVLQSHTVARSNER
jgi:hypothetical protein